ncbi:MAG: hypothetical protein JXQ30_00620, partial [Spirochaetes bacterium]|nr:hypothetical protein [Spirochaetota bacterium]
KRIFLTGDLGRIGRDGRLELAGRRDFQEKIRGYRVDLTEIETVLASHARIKEAVVAAREKEDGEKYLLAYIVCAGSPPPTAGELRRFLLESLPEYMVPSDFITLTELPLTPTGKVDRKRLPAPEHTRPEMDDALISPRNALELRLAKMWEKLLNMRPVGIKDNFFELGGHSILAMRMVSRIEKLTGRTMPVTVLFEAPTVETLAELLVKDGWSPSRICLIPVQPGGSKPPLFYIPPAGMTVIGAADLSRYLGEDQPLYGLQPRGISGRKIEPHRSVEEMASCYIEEIRQVQPEGPYYLAGRCFGGVVAFEMAQQLLAQGQRTAFLGMIDTVFPPGYFRDFGQKKKERAAKPNGRETGSLRRYAGRLLYYLSERPRHLPRALYRKIKTVLKRAFRRTAAQTRKTCRKIYFYASRISLNPGKRRVYRVEVAQYHAKRAYAPSVYPGRITCFWPSEAEQRIARKRIGWQKLSTEMIESHVIPGDHYTMTFEPNVGVLAAALKKCLADAAVESRRRRDENG